MDPGGNLRDLTVRQSLTALCGGRAAAGRSAETHPLPRGGTDRIRRTQILLKPLDVSLLGFQDHLRLIWTMRHSRQNYHPHRDALDLKGVVKLVALRDRHALVGLPMLNQGRGLNTLGVEHCRMSAIELQVFPWLGLEVI